MPWTQFNPNPRHTRTGDCAVRAISGALDISWDDAYLMLVTEGFNVKDMPDKNTTWGACLEQHGYRRGLVDADCRSCYTVRDFAREHPRGTFVLGVQDHVICLRDGSWMDTWDSGGEAPVYYWYKEE